MRLYKDTHSQTVYYTQHTNMSKSIALSLLAQGSNGNEILQILDVIAEDSDDSNYLPILGQSIPSLEEIAF